MTCLLRVGKPRATVLHTVVCGPCWAAHGGSPDAGEIGPAPTVTVPSWDPRDQRHWLSALRRQDWVLDIRADGRANLLAVAKLVALHASWDTLESRPTWARLLARSGLSERTVARWLQELRVRGWLAHLEHGSTPAHRPTVLAHLCGNRAAVYGLRIPLTPQEALHRAAEQLTARLAEDLATQDPPVPSDVSSAPSAPDHPGAVPVTTPSTGFDISASAVPNPQPASADQHQPPTPGDRTGTPSWSSSCQKRSWFHGFTRASKTVDNLGTNPTESGEDTTQHTALRAGLDKKSWPDWALTVPTSRFAMLIAADWLRHRLPVFATCSRKLLRHLCKPYWQAGWCNRDIVHAMDHRPSLFNHVTSVLISPSQIATPTAFIASRLRAWRSPQDAILPGHWSFRLADAAATKAARAQVAARHGQAGAALLRPGERCLTALHITEHGRAARPPVNPTTRAAAKAHLAAALADPSRRRVRSCGASFDHPGERSVG